MKKIICIAGIALLFASIVFAAGITKKTLASLKGTWQGTGTSAAGVTVNVKVEIMNDAEPVQAKLTFSNIPEKMKTEFAIQDPAIGDSNDGKITSAGTIMFTGPNGFFEITSIGKDNKLKGWGYFKGFKADISATKK